MSCLVGNKRIYFIAVRTSDDILTRFAEDDLSSFCRNKIRICFPQARQQGKQKRADIRGQLSILQAAEPTKCFLRK